MTIYSGTLPGIALEEMPPDMQEEAKRIFISGSFLLWLSIQEKHIVNRFASLNPDAEDKAIAQEYRMLRAQLSAVTQIQTLSRQVLEQIKEQSK